MMIAAHLPPAEIALYGLGVALGGLGLGMATYGLYRLLHNKARFGKSFTIGIWWNITLLLFSINLFLFIVFSEITLVHEEFKAHDWLIFSLVVSQAVMIYTAVLTIKRNRWVMIDRGEKDSSSQTN